MDLKTIALILGIAAMLLGGIVFFGSLNDFSSIETPTEVSQPNETSAPITTTTTEIETTTETIPEPTYDPDLRLEVLSKDLLGFEVLNEVERLDPIFDGEQYSTLITFSPTETSPFFGEVFRVTSMLYYFDEPDQIEIALAIVSLGNTLTSFDFLGYTMMQYIDEDARQINIFWSQGSELLQVFSTSPNENEEVDYDALHAAALVLITSIINAQPAE